MELAIAVDGAERPATLTLPPGEVRGAVVLLHGAEAGRRSYFLYEHLARLLEPEGGFLRSGEDRATAQRLLDTAAARPWFEHAYLPPTLPEPGSWPDMDFDPAPILAQPGRLGALGLRRVAAGRRPAGLSGPVQSAGRSAM